MNNLTHWVISIYLFICVSSILGQNGSYIVTNIDSLITEADAAILSEKEIFKIIDKDNAEYTISRRILIKNKNADPYCRVTLSESEFIMIDDVEAVLKTTSGRIIKELESDDIHEAEVTSNNFSDELYNWFELSHHKYPYIIEFTIKKEYNSLFFWPGWYPQSSVPTIHSEYTIINEANIKFDYHAIGGEFIPDSIKIENGYSYKWELNNIPKYKNEDFAPPENEMEYSINFKAANFKLGEYAGSSESWKEFGKFYHDLTKGRFELPSKAIGEIHSVISRNKNIKDKVKGLYKSLQDKNRYVAIELGIRGWQPQRASEVFANRYGDCKDLSTYMIAMLKQAGIKAYYALALTRHKGKVYFDFPDNQFNHVITMVPLENDTLWLECTSSYTDMEDTPYNIEDINVLVVDENSSKMITTPQKSSVENLSKTIIVGNLEKNGNYKFDAELLYTGNRKNYFKPAFDIKSKKDSKIFLQNILNDCYSNLDIEEFKTENKNQTTGEYLVNVSGIYNKFISTRGRRIFICPNIYERKTADNIPDEKIDDRKYPIFYRFPYCGNDSVAISIPDYYKLESIPKNKSVEYSFAKYDAKYFYENNTLKYSRHFEIKQNIIPVEKYAEYLEFLKFVIKADKAKYVFKKQ